MAPDGRISYNQTMVGGCMALIAFRGFASAKLDGALAATISYVYDSNQGESGYVVPKGALFKVTDREGWSKFGYDARGRATNTTRYLATNDTGR